jgi:hypothetical protein
MRFTMRLMSNLAAPPSPLPPEAAVAEPVAVARAATVFAPTVNAAPNMDGAVRLVLTAVVAASQLRLQSEEPVAMVRAATASAPTVSAAPSTVGAEPPVLTAAAAVVVEPVAMARAGTASVPMDNVVPSTDGAAPLALTAMADGACALFNKTNAVCKSSAWPRSFVVGPNEV